MAYRQSIAHLFEFSLKGRKLKSKPRQAPDAFGQPDASIAAGQAGLYVRGLMEAKAGERNLEDIAGTVPGGDHQQVHHFVSNSPWDDSKVRVP